MRYLIVLEETKFGFAVQVPDLAVVTYGETIEAARIAAMEAISINLDAYQEAGQNVPERQPVSAHLENPDFADLLFAYMDISRFEDKMVAYNWPLNQFRG